MVLGITGGLGCGKSTAARLFEGRGFRRLDSDAIVREKALTVPEAMAALRNRYGGGVFASDGSVDRTALGQRVFSDDAEREWLEKLTHPFVFEELRTSLRPAPADGGRPLWIVEVPLLFEQKLENWFDYIVCVGCALSQQLARLEQRGLSRALAEQRISKQLPLARKIESSDFVLWNEGSADFLQAQIDRLIAALAA